MAIDSQHFKGNRRLTNILKTYESLRPSSIQWAAGNLGESILNKTSQWLKTVDMEGRDDVVVVISTTVEVYDVEDYAKMRLKEYE